MWHISRTVLIGLLATMLGMAALACGSSDEELVSQRDYEQEGLESSRALAMDRPSYMAPVDAFREVVEEVTVSGEPGMPGLPGNAWESWGAGARCQHRLQYRHQHRHQHQRRLRCRPHVPHNPRCRE